MKPDTGLEGWTLLRLQLDDQLGRLPSGSGRCEDDLDRGPDTRVDRQVLNAGVGFQELELGKKS